jgi:putative ABC transport system permease protein
MLENVTRDIRYALRSLVKAPSFAAAVIATIALAIAATATIFAVVNGIVLRPLPFPDSERAFALCETNKVMGPFCGASPMNVRDWARSTSSLEAAGVARTESMIAQGSTGAYGVRGGIVLPGFFQVLRVRPMLGRLIEEQDLLGGSNHVVVVGQEFWQQRFGGDPSAVGRSITLDREPYTIVGVLPARMWMPAIFTDVQVWKPLTASIDNVERRSWRGFTAIGLAAKGVSQDKLLADLNVVRSQLAVAYPDANRDWGLHIVNLREKTVGDVSRTLWIFLGTAVFVLLIACANVAGLLLVRATGRVAEFAVRASLGAGRGRLVQQLITESVVLSFAGAMLGIVVAVWATAAFVAVAPSEDIPRLNEVAVDARVVLFTIIVAIVIAILFGIAPARGAWKTDLITALKGLRGGGGSDTRIRAAFAAVQLALALVLLFGAGLLARSFGRFVHWNPGFDRSNIVESWMLPPKMTTSAATVDLMLRVRDEVAAVPGVHSAALGSAGPLFGCCESSALEIEGGAAVPHDQQPAVDWFDVDPRYFDTLGIRLLTGRQFSTADRLGAPPVAVVNATFAKRFFGNASAIGRHVTATEHRAEIVGVVADVTPLRPDEHPSPQIYWPIQQYLRGAAYLIMRISPDVEGLQKSVEARVASVNASIQLNRFRTIDELLATHYLVTPRFNMLLILSFALVALALAAVGVYGVIAYSVARRTRELGIRAALGAAPGDLVRDVVLGGVQLAGIGIAAGCVGAMLAGRLLTSMLYGLTPRDPATLAGAVAVLALVAIVACWLPARRASRIDPVAALRVE